jgi:ABC-type amino acid transport substrate-binding protein
MPQTKKETISFTATITAGTSQLLSQEIKQAATVERIFGKFYPGQQNTLHVQPYLLMSQGRVDQLVTYPSNANAYLSGDDRDFDMPISFDVLPNDKIMVNVNNTGAYDYTLQIAFVVDYQAGTSRA